MDLFQELNREGVTIILVTHEPDIAQHTKRIVTFRDGHLKSDVTVQKPLDAKEVMRRLRMEMEAAT